MDEKISSVILQVKNSLIAQYGEKIKRVILYGSHVRGDATPDSDIDLLVLVDKTLSPWEVRRSLSDLLLDILSGTGELVSVMVLPEDIFEAYRDPFFQNVKKEGLPI